MKKAKEHRYGLNSIRISISEVASQEDINIGIEKTDVNGLTEEVQQRLGDRPIYSFTVTIQKIHKTISILLKFYTTPKSWYIRVTPTVTLIYQLAFYGPYAYFQCLKW